MLIENASLLDHFMFAMQATKLPDVVSVYVAGVLTQNCTAKSQSALPIGIRYLEAINHGSKENLILLGQDILIETSLSRPWINKKGIELNYYFTLGSNCFRSGKSSSVHEYIASSFPFVSQQIVLGIKKAKAM